MEKHTGGPCVRDRLLQVADELFYREGIRAVGIDRVLKEADAAKASLYTHFGSKDELVAACLLRRNQTSREQIAAFMDGVPPAQRALRYFDYVVQSVDAPEFRGCPLQHAVSELSDGGHPARAAVTAQRTWLREQFTAWTTAAGAVDPQGTAVALLVLADGAIAATELDGVSRARDARRMAETILAAATTPAASPRAATRRPSRPRRAPVRRR